MEGMSTTVVSDGPNSRDLRPRQDDIDTVMNDEDEREAEGGVERCDIDSDNSAVMEQYLEQDAHEYPGRQLTVITYGLQREPIGRRQGQAAAPTIQAVRREVHRQWQTLGSRVTGVVLPDQPNDDEAPNPYVVIIALIGDPSAQQSTSPTRHLHEHERTPSYLPAPSPMDHRHATSSRSSTTSWSPPDAWPGMAQQQSDGWLAGEESKTGRPNHNTGSL